MAKEVKAMKNRVEPETHCDVSEARFPCLGICCEARKGVLTPQYLGICPYCSAMTLPIDSTTLQIATLFECSRLGYGRRMTDAKPPELESINKTEGKSK